jgi:hypothetical protein
MPESSTNEFAASDTETNLTITTGDCLGWPCQVVWGNTVSQDLVLKDTVNTFVFPGANLNGPPTGTACCMTLSAWGRNWNSSDNFNVGEPNVTYSVRIKRTFTGEEISWSRN